MKLLTLQSREVLSDQETAVSLNLEDSHQKHRVSESNEDPQVIQPSLLRFKSKFFHENGTTKLQEYDRLVKRPSRSVYTSPMATSRDQQEQSTQNAVVQFSLTNAKLVAANTEYMKHSSSQIYKARTTGNTRRNSLLYNHQQESFRLLDMIKFKSVRRTPQSRATQLLCRGSTMNRHSSTQSRNTSPSKNFKPPIKQFLEKSIMRDKSLQYFVKICQKFEKQNISGRSQEKTAQKTKILRKSEKIAEDIKKRKICSLFKNDQGGSSNQRCSFLEKLSQHYTDGQPSQQQSAKSRTFLQAERDFANFVRSSTRKSLIKGLRYSRGSSYLLKERLNKGGRGLYD